VTGSRSESYSYDLNGNRTGTDYHTTVMNEMSTSPGVHTYTYDNAGNLISDKIGATVTTYTYDYENRLTSVTAGGTVVTYTYNALNQRIGVKASGTQTWTVYDGPSPMANPYADFAVVNGSASLTVRYLFGPTVVNGAVTTGILARTSSGGTTAWYLTDKLGSVRDIVDTSGGVPDHVVYDCFGNIVTETHASNGDRFKFAGMQYDAATGQYYDRARYYNPGMGRFIRHDPTGFMAGDTNLFRYVNNNVTDAVDPSGKGTVTLGVGPDGVVTGTFPGPGGSGQTQIPLSPNAPPPGLYGTYPIPGGGAVEGPTGLGIYTDMFGGSITISPGQPEEFPPDAHPENLWWLWWWDRYHTRPDVSSDLDPWPLSGPPNNPGDGTGLLGGGPGLLGGGPGLLGGGLGDPSIGSTPPLSTSPDMLTTIPPALLAPSPGIGNTAPPLPSSSSVPEPTYDIITWPVYFIKLFVGLFKTS
jgi:RHS repeat-associated protein